MNTPHPYRLRAYHNPEGVDESKVPDGWRLLYAEEAGRPQPSPCRLFLFGDFNNSFDARGDVRGFTYIVPVS